jgi:hypothetical protein
VVDRLGPGGAGAEFNQNDEGSRNCYGSGGLQHHAEGAVVLVSVGEVDVSHLNSSEQNKQNQTEEHNPARRLELAAGARRCLEELQKTDLWIKDIRLLLSVGRGSGAGGFEEIGRKTKGSASRWRRRLV